MTANGISEADQEALNGMDRDHDFVTVKTGKDEARITGYFYTRATVKRMAESGERVYHKTKSGWSRVRSLEA